MRNPLLTRLNTLQLIILALALAGCNLDAPLTSAPTQSQSPAPAPTGGPEFIEQPIADLTAEWELLAPGLERRLYIPDNDEFKQLIALRIDPALYTFRAHYRAGEPLRVDAWVDQLPGVAALINANYFDQQDNALGLLVADGVVYGSTYTDRGGTFMIQNGQPIIRSNLIEPPYPGEPIEQAVQAFPMLVLDSQTAFTNERGDRVARRTAIGLDAAGRVVILVTPLSGLRLTELSAYLPTTDLGLTIAFNLDGGGSTLLYAQVPGSPYLLSSRDPVPAVLAVYPR